MGVRTRNVSYHYQRRLKSPRTKREGTAPESRRHLLTSTVGGRRKGVGLDKRLWSFNLKSRRAKGDRAYLTAADVQV